MDDFCYMLQCVRCFLLTDIYAASEEPIEGVTADALAKVIRATVIMM